MGSNAAEHHPISFKWVLAATPCMKVAESDMLALAHRSLEKVKGTHPKAELLDADYLSVIYLVTEPRNLYHEYAERRLTPNPMTRQAFFALFARPVTRLRG